MDGARMNEDFHSTNIGILWQCDSESDRFSLDNTAKWPVLRV
jgi:hypothetical protein